MPQNILTAQEVIFQLSLDDILITNQNVLLIRITHSSQFGTAVSIGLWNDKNVGVANVVGLSWLFEEFTEQHKFCCSGIYRACGENEVLYHTVRGGVRAGENIDRVYWSAIKLQKVVNMSLDYK